jgi:hypothetical protein
MKLLSTLQARLAHWGHREAHAHRAVQDPGLKAWLGCKPAGRQDAAKALAADLQQALTHGSRSLDLSRHSPQLMASLPTGCVQSLRPMLDQLTLPRGCDVAEVVRWAGHLDLRALSVHDVRPAQSLRDKELPPRLQLLHCDADLMTPADRLTTARLMDTRSQALSASPALQRHGVLSASGAPAPRELGSWVDAQAVVDRCVAARSADHGQMPSKAQALTSQEASQLLDLLRSVPTELLPVRGRMACHLACEWLAHGAQAELTLEQARQLDTALSQARLAFVLPSAHGPRVADAKDMSKLQLLREWEDKGPTAQDRRIREAGFERDLLLGHHQMVEHFKSLQLPGAQATPAGLFAPHRSPPALMRAPAAAPVAAAMAVPTAAKAPARVAGPIGALTTVDAPATFATSGAAASPRTLKRWQTDEQGYMTLRSVQRAAQAPASASASSIPAAPHRVGPQAEQPVEGEVLYDTLPPGPARVEPRTRNASPLAARVMSPRTLASLAPSASQSLTAAANDANPQDAALYDVPPPRPRATAATQAAASGRVSPFKAVAQPQASDVRRSPTHVPVGELEHAKLQLKPYLAWISAPQTSLMQRMNVSAAQLAALGRLVQQFQSSSSLNTAQKRAMEGSTWVMERVRSGRATSLSRSDVSLLAAAVSVLGQLPADETAPTLPARASRAERRTVGS